MQKCAKNQSYFFTIDFLINFECSIICFYLENPTKSSLSRHTLNVAVADEKHFNHSFISPSFVPECPVLQGVMGGMVKCSEITDCGKTEQN